MSWKYEHEALTDRWLQLIADIRNSYLWHCQNYLFKIVLSIQDIRWDQTQEKPSLEIQLHHFTLSIWRLLSFQPIWSRLKIEGAARPRVPTSTAKNSTIKRLRFRSVPRSPYLAVSKSCWSRILDSRASKSSFLVVREFFQCWLDRRPTPSLLLCWRTS
jgi:hypothetical protein